MALLTATECTVYSNISASAATITASGLIPIVQERLTMLCNNYFLTDLDLAGAVTFNATARTIVGANSWAEWNFLADDDIYVYNSYRNDGYYTVASVTTVTLTLASGSTVVDELSGRSVLVSVVKWPVSVKQIAARMVAYDYDVRPSISENVKSHSLGPFSETLSNDTDQFGYPKSITDQLAPWRIARLM